MDDKTLQAPFFLFLRSKGTTEASYPRENEMESHSKVGHSLYNIYGTWKFNVSNSKSKRNGNVIRNSISYATYVV